MGERQTLMLTICSFRGLDCGSSATPTNANSEVEDNISTTPLAHYLGTQIVNFQLNKTLKKGKGNVLIVENTSERITDRYTVTFSCSDTDTSSGYRGYQIRIDYVADEKDCTVE